MSVRVLHFADAHIDMANYGKRNPTTGMPFRVEDFLKAMDTIIDTAISEKVDLVIFAGDAYKDRTPVPTFQREWGMRIMRLSQAQIPTILLVGNHDFSPSQGRAHTLQEFDTLQIPFIHVISNIELLNFQEMYNLPIQVIWNAMGLEGENLDSEKNKNEEIDDLNATIETSIGNVVEHLIQEADPDLPVIFTAHASVLGAKFGRERNVMLGKDLVISKSLVCDPRLDYCALGHIHKPQNLNEDSHPPVIYPGSIERVDFGEAEDKKYFILATIEKGHTEVEWRELKGRTFIDCSVTLKEDAVNVSQLLINALPSQELMENAIVRLVVHYPEAMETRIDPVAVLNYAENCFDFRLIKRPEFSMRLRLSPDQQMNSLSPLQLLDLYLKVKHVTEGEEKELLEMAQIVLNDDTLMEGE